MKEPDKWCIKITPENREAIKKWRTSKILLSRKGYCVNKNSFNLITGYLYPDKPSGYTEISFEEFKVYTSKPLKQAVHCTTQEEWDFVILKTDNSFFENWFAHEAYGNNESYCIGLDDTQKSASYEFYKETLNYEILSFQEWCDLNGYKMESKLNFEIGKWYKYNDWYLKLGKIENDLFIASEYIDRDRAHRNNLTNFPCGKADNEKVLLFDLSEIQQYLPDDHPDKIKSNQEFKVGDWVVVLEEDDFYSNSEKCPQKLMGVKEYGLPYKLLFKDGHINHYRKIRHATEKEMQEYFRENEDLLKKEVSEAFKDMPQGLYYQIDKISTETKMYKHFNEILDRMKGETSKPSYHLLSTDDEELPMVNIIKTNTVKQLLNND